MRQKIDIKKSELNQRICQIRQVFFDDSNRDFATKIGESEQNLSNICSPEAPRNASLTIIKKILINIPTVNARWLITGEGEIVSSDTNSQVAGDNNGVIVQRGGNGNTYSNGGDSSALLNIIGEQQDTINRQSEQITTLLGMINK